MQEIYCIVSLRFWSLALKDPKRANRAAGFTYWPKIAAHEPTTVFAKWIDLALKACSISPSRLWRSAECEPVIQRKWSTLRKSESIPHEQIAGPTKAEPNCRCGLSRAAAVRVLVVEDFEPFLQFISSTLGKTRDLQVIGEVSDGLEAVEKAVKLKPDLILMDIGLPSLSGIEAARQIRKLVPESKIIFFSQECSADVVQEALSLGAWGYVVKTRGTDLLAAVDAVILGKRFVSRT